MFRPLAETTRDTWDWLRSEAGSAAPAGTTLATPMPASLSRERERDLISEWRAR
jgi:hypothetical protein